MKKIYVYNGPGLCNGSTVVVVAKTKEEAKEMIQFEVEQCMGLIFIEDEIIQEFKLKEGVVYSSNGDY